MDMGATKKAKVEHNNRISQELSGWLNGNPHQADGKMGSFDLKIDHKHCYLLWGNSVSFPVFLINHSLLFTWSYLIIFSEWSELWKVVLIKMQIGITSKKRSLLYRNIDKNSGNCWLSYVDQFFFWFTERKNLIIRVATNVSPCWRAWTQRYIKMLNIYIV